MNRTLRGQVKVKKQAAPESSAPRAPGAKMKLSVEDRAALLAQLASIERQVNSAHVQIERLRDTISKG